MRGERSGITSEYRTTEPICSAFATIIAQIPGHSRVFRKDGERRTGPVRGAARESPGRAGLAAR
jgi:hypothetical protein